MGDGWEQRLRRHDRFLKNGEGHFLILGGYWEGRPEDPDPYGIPGQSNVMSYDFLDAHAYELGVQAAKFYGHCLRNLSDVDDDGLPCLAVEWGAGGNAALFSGASVMFEESTGYTTETVVKTWDDVDRLKFNPDGRWAKYDLEYWRGVAAEYPAGLALTPHNFRSPLDLANDLRGNQLFMDMYDAPEQVDRLVTVCTDMIIEACRFLRAEVPLLREAPSGAWGMATSEPERMIFVNGDPVDLISLEMGERFNHPHIERLARELGPVFFHHHTLGVSRVTSVSKIAGLAVQNFIYDAKAPKILDIVDDEWIEASRRVPIHVCQDLTEADDIDAVLEKMSPGRFIVQLNTTKRDTCNELIAKIRSYDD